MAWHNILKFICLVLDFLERTFPLVSTTGFLIHNQNKKKKETRALLLGIVKYLGKKPCVKVSGLLIQTNLFSRDEN